MTQDPAWLVRARAFRADDPDPDTQAELDALLARYPADAGAERELRERFSTRLEFGTAGLRGLLGAGDARMNRRVVAQTTAALCAALREALPDAAQRGLCIGFDGRHKSREFAEEARAVANGAGFVVHAFEAPGPTPLLAFSVLERAAAGGVMITASHNPAAYNGYKVYWSDGAQLNTPHDAEVARHMHQLGDSVLALPRLPLTAARATGLYHSLTGTEGRYLSALARELGAPRAAPAPGVAYSALHGVGETLARAALSEAGVVTLHSVAEQAAPDPDFPSVRFPNPEEPGALDKVLELGERTNADLALANDPDADRLAAAARSGAGTLQALTGNELGVLLCDYLLSQAPRDGRNLIVTTVVSTPLAARIARAHGARTEITLTGFKWIIRRARELEQQGLRFVLGFEEALGYCIGHLVRDKDGIAAAGHVARMAQYYAERGSTLPAALEALYRTHGLYESRQYTLSSAHGADLAPLQARLSELRSQPPTHIAGLPVTASRDLRRPTDSSLPPSDLWVLELDDAHRISIRPSGTEPKLKIYVDCSATPQPNAELSASRHQLQRISQLIGDDLRARLGL